MKTAKQILLDAAAHIDRVGLFKGDYRDNSGKFDYLDAPCCALGAMRIAVCNKTSENWWFILESEDPEQFAEYMKAVTTVILHNHMMVQDWNDLPEVTKDNVVIGLLGAADSLPLDT